MVRAGNSLLGILLLAMAIATPAAAQPQKPTAVDKNDTKEMNLRAYAELLRADVRAEKVAIFTELMQFTETEDKAFWPIYREYDVELSKVNDERVGMIDEYAKNYTQVTDALADKLALKALELETRRTGVKQKYDERMKSALSAKTAARFLQIENQLLHGHRSANRGVAPHRQVTTHEKGDNDAEATCQGAEHRPGLPHGCHALSRSPAASIGESHRGHCSSPATRRLCGCCSPTGRKRRLPSRR